MKCKMTKWRCPHIDINTEVCRYKKVKTNGCFLGVGFPKRSKKRKYHQFLVKEQIGSFISEKTRDEVYREKFKA